MNDVKVDLVGGEDVLVASQADLRQPRPEWRHRHPPQAEAPGLHGLGARQVISRSGCRSCQFIEQRLRVLQVWRIKAFHEPAVDWREQIPGVSICPGCATGGCGVVQRPGWRFCWGRCAVRTANNGHSGWCWSIILPSVSTALV